VRDAGRSQGRVASRLRRPPAQALTFIDITGSVVYALVVPYAAVALTL
jgi:hypothetical protein